MLRWTSAVIFAVIFVKRRHKAARQQTFIVALDA
jgi:hypothetical protein